MNYPFITDEQRSLLLANGQESIETPDVDPPPAIKLFTPDAGATWLPTEIDPDNHDHAFGLCDLGLGMPELGWVSLAELALVRGRLGLPIERDLHFRAESHAGRFPPGPGCGAVVTRRVGSTRNSKGGQLPPLSFSGLHRSFRRCAPACLSIDSSNDDGRPVPSPWRGSRIAVFGDGGQRFLLDPLYCLGTCCVSLAVVLVVRVQFGHKFRDSGKVSRNAASASVLHRLDRRFVRNQRSFRRVVLVHAHSLVFIKRWFSEHSRRFQHPHFHAQTSSGSHIDEGIQAEQIGLTTQQVGHARLCYSEYLGRLRLA